MTNLQIPVEIQALLDAGDVDTVMILVEEHDPYLFTARDCSFNDLIQKSPQKDSLVSYLRKWVVEHASFEELRDILHVEKYEYAQVVGRMVSLATPKEVHGYIVDELDACGHKVESDEWKNIRPFVYAAQTRDAAYSKAIVSALLSYLEIESRKPKDREVFAALLKKAVE